MVHFAWLEGNIHSNHYNFISSKQLLFLVKMLKRPLILKAMDSPGRDSMPRGRGALGPACPTSLHRALGCPRTLPAASSSGCPWGQCHQAVPGLSLCSFQPPLLPENWAPVRGATASPKVRGVREGTAHHSAHLGLTETARASRNQSLLGRSPEKPPHV